MSFIAEAWGFYLYRKELRAASHALLTKIKCREILNNQIRGSP